MTQRLVFTTHPGLEPFVRQELRTLGARVLPEPARVGRVEASFPPHPGFGKLRTVHDVLEPLGTFRLRPESGLDSIRAAVSAMDVPSYSALDFRVVSARLGRHPFNRIQVERAVGGVLHRRLGIPVRLEAPELIIRADVTDDFLDLGRLLTRVPLSHRPGPFNQRVGLSAVVAASLVRASGVCPKTVLDPFCGSGTILIEAGAAFPEAGLLGSDWVAGAAEGARQNLRAARLDARAAVAVRDASRLEHPKGSIDLVASNPPFGVRLGRKVRFLGFFRKFLGRVSPILSKRGRVALLVHRHEQLTAAARLEGFRLVATYPVTMGTMRPSITVLEPAGAMLRSE